MPTNRYWLQISIGCSVWNGWFRRQRKSEPRRIRLLCAAVYRNSSKGWRLENSYWLAYLWCTIIPGEVSCWTLLKDCCYLGLSDAHANELSREEFLHLHAMEASDCKDSNVDDLWIMLESMGFNRQLLVDAVSGCSRWWLSEEFHVQESWY